MRARATSSPSSRSRRARRRSALKWPHRKSVSHSPEIPTSAPPKSIAACRRPRDQVYAQETRSAQDRQRDARYAAELVGLSNFDRGRREIEQRWQKTLLESQGSPGATALNRRAMAAELDTYTRGQQLEPLKQGRQALLDQSAALERLKQGFGATAGAAAEFAARQQLLNDYQRNNIPITAGVRAEIERLAVAQGRTAQASEDLQKAQQKVVGAMDEVRNGSRGAFTSMFSAMRQGKSVSEAFRNSVGNMLDRGFERAVSAPLTEMLMGKDGQPGGGLFGDSMGKLFGGKAVQTANISAGTVIVNGNAVGGATGLPGDPAKAGAANDNAAGVAGLQVFNKQQGGEDWYAKIADRVPQAAPAVPLGPFGGLNAFTAGEASFERSVRTLQETLDRRGAQPAAVEAVPVPPIRPVAIDQFEGSMRRAAVATDNLQGNFQDVAKTLDTGASNMKSSAGEFTNGADGVFGAIIGGVGRIGNSFVSGLGTVLQSILQALSQSGGGGFGGIFGSIFGGGETAISSSLSAMPQFASGGIATRASIFGEAGPEAAVPLPDGRRIPVALRLSGMPANDTTAMVLPLTALSGAIGKLNERIASGAAAPSSGGAPGVVIENRSGAAIRTQEEDKPGGGRRQRVIIDEAVADAAGRHNSRIAAALGGQQRMTRR